MKLPGAADNSPLDWGPELRTIEFDALFRHFPSIVGGSATAAPELEKLQQNQDARKPGSQEARKLERSRQIPGCVSEQVYRLHGRNGH
jgi:hypothetical protein